MRQALALGAFALLVAGCGALAGAQPAVGHAARTAAASAEPLIVDQAASPDVGAWTAELTSSKHQRGGSEIRKFAAHVVNRTSRIAAELTHDALRFLGTPYVFGGESRYGFDCSGFTQHVFAMLGVTIPRTADAQYYAGRRTKGGPHPGDLVFFQTYEPGPSHVGIYLGHGEFVHASSSHGVMVSHLSDSYWQARYLGAKRLLASR